MQDQTWVYLEWECAKPHLTFAEGDGIHITKVRNKSHCIQSAFLYPLSRSIGLGHEIDGLLWFSSVENIQQMCSLIIGKTRLWIQQGVFSCKD